MKATKWRVGFMVLVFIISSLFFCCPLSAGATEPAIKVSKVARYGTAGSISGKVKGVNPGDFYIITYIKVEDVWWIKPTLASPWTKIEDNGKFSCYFTTGGNDIYTQEIALKLVPKSQTYPLCNPCYELPDITGTAAEKNIKRGPKTKKLIFSGYTWDKKKREYEAGPGGNYFSDNKKHVWVDKKDKSLHLTIKKAKDGKWYATEVINTEPLDYGLYRIITNSRVDLLDPMAVFGIFTYDTGSPPAFGEIDIEFARWGSAGEYTNYQYVVQPCSACPGCGGNCQRYRLDLTDEDKFVTHYIYWQPDKVEFRTYRGNWVNGNPPANQLVSSWIYAGDIPEPGKGRFRLNLWLFNGVPPINGQTNEVVISNFAVLDTVPWDETPLTGNLKIDGVSVYGDAEGIVWGDISGVAHDLVAVAVYIYVNGGWYNKPAWDTPLTLIGADNKWVADITTGENDKNATVIKAFLLPKDYDPPLAYGENSLPQSLYDNALSSDTIERQEPYAEPEVVIDGVSPYGEMDGYAWGHIQGAKPEDVAIAVYIFTYNGWWNKPAWAWPLTTVGADNKWITDIVTGGVDEYATAITVCMVPAGAEVPILGGHGELPPELFNMALSCDSVTR